MNRSTKMMIVAPDVRAAAVTAPASAAACAGEGLAPNSRVRRFAAAQPVMLNRTNTPAAQIARYVSSVARNQVTHGDNPDFDPDRFVGDVEPFALADGRWDIPPVTQSKREIL